MPPIKTKHLSKDEILAKAQNYCAYQERCKTEVYRKLLSWGVLNNETEEIIKILEKEKFLSDDRFTEIYVRSKVNQKKWGKIKIEAELKARNIPFTLIKEQIDNIDVDVYHENIRSLIDGKIKDLESLPPIKQQQKLNQYLLSKGYETEIIIRFLKQSFL